MTTIGRIPTCLCSSLRPWRRDFAKPAWSHFWGLVTAIGIGTDFIIERLNALLRSHWHRTNNGEFLWRSHWDEAGVPEESYCRIRHRHEPPTRSVDPAARRAGQELPGCQVEYLAVATTG